MKKSLIILAFVSAIVACEDCDDGTSAANPDQDIVATFKVKSVLIPEAADLNQDGTASSDLVDESECFASSFLTFNSDGTFRHRQNNIDVNGESTDCHSKTISGTWVRDNQNITATAYATGESMHFGIDEETNTITHIRYADYPRINHETGNAETSQGEVTTVFEVD